MAHMVKVKGPTLTLSERPLQDFWDPPRLYFYPYGLSNFSRMTVNSGASYRPFCPDAVLFWPRPSNFGRTVPISRDHLV